MRRQYSSVGLRVSLSLTAAILFASVLGTASALAQTGSVPAIEIPAAPKDPALAGKVPDYIRDKGSLSVVMSPNNPPGHFFDEKTQTMVGLNPDLGKALAEVLGLKSQVTGVDMRQVVPGLQSQRYDVAVAMMSPTEERRKVLDFFDYLASGVKLAVKKGNGKQFSLDDWGICGHSVAVNGGSAQDIRNAPELSAKCVAAGKPPITIARFTDFQTASLAVISGRADAVMFDATAIDYMVKKLGELEVAGSIDSKAVSIGVAKGSPMFPLLRTAFIELMKDGIYQKILVKWGLDNSAVPDPVINNPNG
jgi:polar amino acid transport system substrate-binding protein